MTVYLYNRLYTCCAVLLEVCCATCRHVPVSCGLRRAQDPGGGGGGLLSFCWWPIYHISALRLSAPWGRLFKWPHDSPRLAPSAPPTPFTSSAGDETHVLFIGLRRNKLLELQVNNKYSLKKSSAVCVCVCCVCVCVRARRCMSWFKGAGCARCDE